MPEQTLPSESKSRYSWGADEHLAVQLDEEMSLSANFKVMEMAAALVAAKLDGIHDICPANASLLIRFDPDRLDPRELEETARTIEAEVAKAGSPSLATRILEVPCWYNDPMTREVGAKFRDRHQRPEGNDLEFAMAELGLDSVEQFIARHSGSPWLVSMVGFVAGLPFMFQMVEREQQIDLPKYLRPRTDTLKLTVGHGGCFGCIYSVRGAGGYQMFGITPLPIYDPKQQHAIFSESMVLFRPGDIVKFRPVDEAEYCELERAADAGEDVYKVAEVEFALNEFLADPDAYNARLMGALDAR
jgi:urea carboxylase